MGKHPGEGLELLRLTAPKLVFCRVTEPVANYTDMAG